MAAIGKCNIQSSGTRSLSTTTSMSGKTPTTTDGMMDPTQCTHSLTSILYTLISDRYWAINT